MILTVTANPAVDKTACIDTLLAGNVNRMNSITEYAGGKGINVTRILAQYGHEVTAMGFLGGYPGKYIKKEVEKCGATGAFTMISGTTRTNLNLLGADGYITELLEPGPVITKKEQENSIATFTELASKAEIIVLSGSIPEGVSPDYYQKLIKIANEMNKKVILDTSKEALRLGIEALPYLIKPNVKELEYLTGKRLSRIDQLVDAAKEYRRMGIAKVVVSMGAKGLLYVDAKKTLIAVPPKQSAVNTVGCGDAVVASYAMSLQNKDTEEEAIRKAAAISAANATTMENGVIPMVKATQFLEKVKCKEYSSENL